MAEKVYVFFTGFLLGNVVLGESVHKKMLYWHQDKQDNAQHQKPLFIITLVNVSLNQVQCNCNGRYILPSHIVPQSTNDSGSMLDIESLFLKFSKEDYTPSLEYLILKTIFKNKTHVCRLIFLIEGRVSVNSLVST